MIQASITVCLRKVGAGALVRCIDTVVDRLISVEPVVEFSDVFSNSFSHESSFETDADLIHGDDA